MKHLLLTSILLLSAYFSNANVRTVSNNPGTPAQFNTIQAAVNASASGDTIYISGGPTSYQGFSSSIPLTYIGTGFAPLKNSPLVSSINLDLSAAGIQLNAGAAGSTFIGIRFDGFTAIGVNSPAVNNLKFIRNRFVSSRINFNSSGTFTNMVFESNVFQNADVRSNASSQIFAQFLFINNIFFETGCCISGNISGFTNATNFLFDHNLWYGPNGSGNRDCFSSSCANFTLSNNIFINRNAANNLSNATFTKCLTFNTSNNTPWLSNGNIDGSGNLTNTDPQMTNQTVVGTGNIDVTADYSISSGPANNSGTDGKDLGLLYDATGALNWDFARNPGGPMVTKFNVLTPSITSGNNISVEIEAKARN